MIQFSTYTVFRVVYILYIRTYISVDSVHAPEWLPDSLHNICIYVYAKGQGIGTYVPSIVQSLGISHYT